MKDYVMFLFDFMLILKVHLGSFFLHLKHCTYKEMNLLTFLISFIFIFAVFSIYLNTFVVFIAISTLLFLYL